MEKESVKELSIEEVNLVERSTKKVKTTRISGSGEEIWGTTEVAIEEEENLDSKRKGSYKDMLMGDIVGNPELEGESNYSIEESDNEEDEEESDCPTIRISKKENARLRRKWQKAVIIKLLGKKVGEEKNLSNLGVKSPITISDLGNDFYVVRFNNHDEYENALFGGPWIIVDHYLAVKQWTPNFDLENARIDRLAVWVRFPSLPIEYYDRMFLTRLGNRIDRTVQVDDTTVDASRAKFARVCVEVDLNKSLISKYRLRRRVTKMEYEAIHLVCFDCGLYRHRMEDCPKSKEKEEDREMQEEDMGEHGGDERQLNEVRP